jgi:16S rRNA (adenine1518-N6/adenine1519-N6)-dimethyltransferase
MTSPIKELTAFGLKPKKHMGQNFLTDISVPDMIIKKAGICEDDIILEIGAGLGIMTKQAAIMAKKVYAVEKDYNLSDILTKKIEFADFPKNINVINKDIFKVDLIEIYKENDSKIIVLGNLPYNISSQILVKLIKERKAVKKAVIMLQKEAAERILAAPCCKKYGRLTVMLNFCGNISKLCDVKSHLFYPKPKVDSSVISIDFFENNVFNAIDEKFLFTIIKTAFGKRRKNLRNALYNSTLNMEKNYISEILEKINIDPKRRGETLSVKEFVELSNSIFLERNIV